MEYRIQSAEELAERKARERAVLLAMPRERMRDLTQSEREAAPRDISGSGLGLGVGITDDEDGLLEQ